MIAYLKEKGLSIEIPDDSTDEDIQQIYKEFEGHSAEALQQADPQTLKDPGASLQTWKPNFYEAWIKPAAQELGVVDIPMVQDRDPAAYAFTGKAIEQLSFGAVPAEKVFETDYEKHPIASTLGSVLGGFGSLMTTGGALQATKLPAVAYKAGQAGTAITAAAARFVPPAIMNAATFGTHTFITKTVDALHEGGVDIADFGMDVMKDTAFGGAIGAVSGVASVPKAIGAAYGLGYLSSKVDGGDEAENHINGAIWAIFEGVGSFGRDKRLREQAIKNLSDSIGEYVRQRRPSMSPEAAAEMGQKIVMRAANKVGGMEAVVKSQKDTLGFIEDLNQQVRKAKIQVMEPVKPKAEPKAEASEIQPVRIEGPKEEANVTVTPKTEVATGPKAVSEPSPETLPALPEGIGIEKEGTPEPTAEPPASVDVKGRKQKKTRSATDAIEQRINSANTIEELRVMVLELDRIVKPKDASRINEVYRKRVQEILKANPDKYVIITTEKQTPDAPTQKETYSPINPERAQEIVQRVSEKTGLKIYKANTYHDIKPKGRVPAVFTEDEANQISNALKDENLDKDPIIQKNDKGNIVGVSFRGAQVKQTTTEPKAEEAVAEDPRIEIIKAGHTAKVTGNSIWTTISPSTRPDEKGKFQVSWFSRNDVPLGHNIKETFEEALKAAKKEAGVHDVDRLVYGLEHGFLKNSDLNDVEKKLVKAYREAKANPKIAPKVSEAAADVKEGLGESKIDEAKAKKLLLEKLEGYLKKAPVEKDGVLEISIPGDGNFKVVNQKSVLEGLIKRVKAMPTGAGKETSEPTTKKVKYKAELPLVKTEDTKIMTDGRMMAIAKDIPKTTKYKESSGQEAISSKKATDQIFKLAAPYDAKIVQYEAGSLQEGYGVSDRPIATKFDDNPNRAVFEFTDAEGNTKDIFINQNYVLYFQERFDDITYKASDKQHIAVFSGDKRVGIILGIDRKGVPRIDDSPAGEMAQEAADLKNELKTRKAELEKAKGVVFQDPKDKAEYIKPIKDRIAEIERRIRENEFQQAGQPKGGQAGGGARGFRAAEPPRPGSKGGMGYAKTSPADQKAALLQKLGGLEYVQKMQGPELVKLAKELMGNVPVIKKMARYWGLMRPSGKGQIELNKDIFKDARLWEMVLAHEIGHLMDYLPDRTLKRGNILGRLASLKSYFTETLAERPGAATGALTEKDRRRLRAEAERLAKKKVAEAGQPKDDADKIEPQAILNIWNAVEADADPALLSYIKTLNSEEKKSIVKEAMSALKKGEKVTIKDIKKFNKEAAEDPSSVNKIYADLVKEEIKKRQLYEHDVVRKELKDLTVWWHPFLPIPGDTYTRYRFGSDELYADFISVMLNAPAKAKEFAPTAYKAFWNYLERKPEVMKALLELQTLIQGDDASLQKVRGEDILAMFERGEDAFRERHALLQAAKRSVMSRIKIAIIDTNSPLLEMRNKIAANQPLSPAKDPKYFIEQNSMLSSFVRSYMEDFDRAAYVPAQDEGLLDDVKIMLFLDRVGADRAELANPLGHTPETAKAYLEDFQKRDPQKYQRVSDLAQAARDWFRNVSLISGHEQFFTPAQIAMIRSSDKYAPYRVVDYMRDYMAAGFAQQVGTFKDIGDPMTSMALKGISVMTAIRRNQIKMELARFLSTYGFNVRTAKVTEYPGHFSIEQPSDPNLGTLSWKENGKWKAIHIDKDIANIFDRSTEEINQAASALRIFLANHVFRSTYVTFNLSFQSVNLFRDFMRTWANTPGMTMRKLAGLYKSSIGEAARRAAGEYDPTVQAMQREGALNITFNDLILGQTDETKEMDSIRAKYDLAEQQGTKWENIPGVNLIIKALDAIRFGGDVIESLSKIAGWKALQHMPSEQRAYWIRNLIGTPNFKRRGTLTPITNEIFLFSNIIKEGYRGFGEIAFGKENRQNQGEYWRKRVLVSILPKLIMRLAAAGLLGTGAAIAINRTSEYLKSSYTVVPLGFDIDNKPVTLNIPQDEDGRFIGAIFWKMINMIPLTEEESKLAKFKNWEDEFKDVFDLTSGQVLPGTAPAIEVYSNWIGYLRGQNPRDSFRGNDILTEEQYRAGGLEAFNPMVVWTINQTGLTRLDARDIQEDKSIVRSVIEMTPVVQRFIRVGDSGEYQAARIAQQQALKEETQARLAVRNIVKEQKAKGLSDDKILQGARSVDEYRQIQTALKRYNKKSLSNPTAKAVVSASSNNQKVQILQNAKQFYSDEDYKELILDLYESRGISARVYMEALDK